MTYKEGEIYGLSKKDVDRINKLESEQELMRVLEERKKQLREEEWEIFVFKFEPWHIFAILLLIALFSCNDAKHTMRVYPHGYYSKFRYHANHSVPQERRYDTIYLPTKLYYTHSSYLSQTIH